MLSERTSTWWPLRSVRKFLRARNILPRPELYLIPLFYSLPYSEFSTLSKIVLEVPASRDWICMYLCSQNDILKR